MGSVTKGAFDDIGNVILSERAMQLVKGLYGRYS